VLLFVQSIQEKKYFTLSCGLVTKPNLKTYYVT